MKLNFYEIVSRKIHALKGYCTVFQYALKLLEKTGMVLT